jgi:hypothetical protein
MLFLIIPVQGLQCSVFALLDLLSLPEFKAAGELLNTLLILERGFYKLAHGITWLNIQSATYCAYIVDTLDIACIHLPPVTV